METVRPLYGKTVGQPFEKVLEAAEVALHEQEFGILCRIDVQAKLREKLGVEFQPYVILGACLPAMAHKALTANPEIGIMLPCNVVVRGLEQGQTRVEVVNTEAMVRMFPSVELRAVADEVGRRLDQVLEAL